MSNPEFHTDIIKAPKHKEAKEKSLAKKMSTSRINPDSKAIYKIPVEVLKDIKSYLDDYDFDKDKKYEYIYGSARRIIAIENGKNPDEEELDFSEEKLADKYYNILAHIIKKWDYKVDKIEEFKKTRYKIMKGMPKYKDYEN